jgi:phosphoribosyl 1,2-cyclic phosphodiesterase
MILVKSANSASAVNAFEILMRNSRTRSILDDHSLLNASFKTNRKRFRFQKHNSFGSYNPSCPAFKTIKGTSPPFVVDGFKYCRKDLTDIYFLTHFHSDHYVGLDKVNCKDSIYTRTKM